MHDQFSKDGLVILGVLLDDPGDAALRADGLKYLGRIKPPFENLYLDTKPEIWQKKLRLNGYPGVYVFNRDNRHVKKLPVLDDKGEETEEVDYDVVARVVADLMKK